jgi:hypothetical protein
LFLRGFVGKPRCRREAKRRSVTAYAARYA